MHATVFVPGYGNSVNGHWQELWYHEMENSYWVDQKNWDNPVCSVWVETFNTLIQSIKEPIFLITHSLGGNTVIEWSRLYTASIIGAFFVVFPDVQGKNLPKEIIGYENPPLGKLPFPSVAIASTNDPYSTIERTIFFAEKWGSRVITVGDAGHVNVDAGFGHWPEGKKQLIDFIKSLNG